MTEVLQVLDQQLPSYSPSRSPPSYTPQALAGEATLAQTSRFHSISTSHPTGTFTKHVGEISITLSEQDQDVDIPSYGRHGVLSGNINVDPSIKVEDIIEVVFKVGLLVASFVSVHILTCKV